MDVESKLAKRTFQNELTVNDLMSQPESTQKDAGINEILSMVKYPKRSRVTKDYVIGGAMSAVHICIVQQLEAENFVPFETSPQEILKYTALKPLFSSTEGLEPKDFDLALAYDTRIFFYLMQGDISSAVFTASMARLTSMRFNDKKEAIDVSFKSFMYHLDFTPKQMEWVTMIWEPLFSNSFMIVTPEMIREWFGYIKYSHVMERVIKKKFREGDEWKEVGKEHPSVVEYNKTRTRVNPNQRYYMLTGKVFKHMVMCNTKLGEEIRDFYIATEELVYMMIQYNIYLPIARAHINSFHPRFRAEAILNFDDPNDATFFLPNYIPLAPSRS